MVYNDTEMKIFSAIMTEIIETGECDVPLVGRFKVKSQITDIRDSSLRRVKIEFRPRGYMLEVVTELACKGWYDK